MDTYCKTKSVFGLHLENSKDLPMFLPCVKGPLIKYSLSVLP